jgi:hypothetical protein
MRSIVCIITLLWSAAASCADVYDWGYTITGDPRVAPIQVFDNGKQTWIQFRNPEPPPAIFAVTAAGQAVLTGNRDGQFIILNRVERQLSIALGSARASVRYTGNARADDAAMFGTAVPVKATGIAPSPVPAEQILASRASTPNPVSAEPAPIAAPIPAATAPVAAASPAAEPKPALDAEPTATWKVLQSDVWLSKTLLRWALAAGWEVSWEARDFPVTVTPTYDGTFRYAVERIALGVSDSDAPITADFRVDGKNKVVRIVRFEGNSGNGK